MSQLVIEYVFEGHRRGYNITEQSRGHDEKLLKAIWRDAMPRGQGWGGYIGARSLKVFALPDDLVGVSVVTVTDQADENGRRGIRRAEVEILAPRIYDHHLKSLWLRYPSHVMADARDKHADLCRAITRVKRNSPLVIAHPYTRYDDWQVLEAAMILLILDPPRPIRRLDDPVTFTTLALDPLRETQIIAMPVEKAADVTDGIVVRV